MCMDCILNCLAVYYLLCVERTITKQNRHLSHWWHCLFGDRYHIHFISPEIPIGLPASNLPVCTAHHDSLCLLFPLSPPCWNYSCKHGLYVGQSTDRGLSLMPGGNQRPICAYLRFIIRSLDCSFFSPLVSIPLLCGVALTPGIQDTGHCHDSSMFWFFMGG